MLRILIILSLLCGPAFAKNYSGSEWQDDTAKVYDGAAWVAATKNYYTGAAWVEIEPSDPPDYIALAAGNEDNGDPITFGIGTVSTSRTLNVADADFLSGYAFDIGASDVVSIPIANINPNAFRLTFNFKNDGTPEAYGKFFIGGTEAELQMYRFASDVAVRVDFGNTTVYSHSSATVNIWDGARHGVELIVYNDTDEVAVKYDGVAQTNEETGVTWPGDINPTQPLYIGNRANGERTIGSMIGDFTVYDYPPPPTSGTVYYGYPADEDGPADPVGSLIGFGNNDDYSIYVGDALTTGTGTLTHINFYIGEAAQNPVYGCVYDGLTILGTTADMQSSSANNWTGEQPLIEEYPGSLDYTVGTTLKIGSCHAIMPTTNGIATDSGDTTTPINYNNTVWPWVGGAPGDINNWTTSGSQGLAAYAVGEEE